MTDDKKALIQETIERLLYCQEYKNKLEELNKQFNPTKEVKFTKNISEFLFPIDKAI